MKADKKTMLLYAVTDRTWTKEKSLAEQVKEAVDAGVTCVQLREKDLPYDEFLREAMEISKICREKNVTFIVNDNIEIAIKCEADGIHIGQSDTELKKARMLVGDEMIIGVSVHSKEEALKAIEQGADYLGVGAVFATTTKKDAYDMPYETLKEICEISTIPTVAIGGISEDNIEKIKDIKTDGIAVVSAIFSKKDIKKATKQLLELSTKYFG